MSTPQAGKNDKLFHVDVGEELTPLNSKKASISTRTFLPKCNAVLDAGKSGDATLLWNVELDIQALKGLGRYLTCQY